MSILILSLVFLTAHGRVIDENRQESTSDFILKINQASGLVGVKDVFDGDIKRNVRESKAFRYRRNAISTQSLLWQSGIVPYEIEPSLSILAKSSIRKAMKFLQTKTCIRFRLREATDDHFVKFSQGSGCWSYIGRNILPEKSYQELVLGDNCFTEDIVLHEMMHLLGFYHEHSRYDRDQFINVYWDNINPANFEHFQPVSPTVSKFDYDSYDYRSIMHYGNKAFSINEQPTLEAKDDAKRNLGGKKLSKKDIKKINSLYNCQEKRLVGVWADWSPWGECMGSGLQTRLRKCLENDVTLCPGVYFDGYKFDERNC